MSVAAVGTKGGSTESTLAESAAPMQFVVQRSHHAGPLDCVSPDLTVSHQRPPGLFLALAVRQSILVQTDRVYNPR